MKIATPPKETGEAELLLTSTHPLVDECTHARSLAGLKLIPTSFLIAQIVLIVCYTAVAAIVIASFKPQIASPTSKYHGPKITMLGKINRGRIASKRSCRTRSQALLRRQRAILWRPWRRSRHALARNPRADELQSVANRAPASRCDVYTLTEE